MLRYLVRRLLLAIPLVLGITTILFFVVNLAPGDPVQLMTTPGMSPEVVAQIRANLGLDQPLPVQYVRWLSATLRGDLGYSFSHSRPVLEVIGQILPNTLLLSGCALALAFLGGILLGIVQAVRQYSLWDRALTVLALFFYSMPSFWLALMMIMVFALYARNVWEWPIYFPPSGTRSIEYASLALPAKILDRIRYATLPVVSLTLVLAAGIARYTRGSMLEVVRQDFVRTARAKGLPEHQVILKHALRNALIPVITLLGLYLPVVFSGSVFIETIYGWPGMGKTIIDAITTRDYPLVMATSLIFALLVVAGNLIADVLYAVVDPRIRYE